MKIFFKPNDGHINENEKDKKKVRNLLKKKRKIILSKYKLDKDIAKKEKDIALQKLKVSRLNISFAELEAEERRMIEKMKGKEMERKKNSGANEKKNDS